MIARPNSLFLLYASTVLLLETKLVSAQFCGSIRERWAWTDHTCSEQDEYLEAVFALKENGTYDEFVRVHRAMNGIAHGVSEFLPWHRWFIYRFEDALREVSGNPCMTIPYWDWEDSTVFDEETFDWFVGRDEDSGSCRWVTPNGECLRRDMDQSISMWRSGQILGMIMNYDQYSDDFSRNPQRNNGFRAAMEGGPHAAPHAFIGGSMLEMVSPIDPLFFAHHANVDRLWSLWQDYNDHDQIDTSLYETPVHYEGQLLDMPMVFARNRLFRMDNGSYPTPRDVLSNNNVVNVLYRNDQLARRLRYDANPDWFELAPQGSDIVWCDRNVSRERRKRRELEQLRKESYDLRNKMTSITEANNLSSQKKGVEFRKSSSASSSFLRGNTVGLESTSSHMQEAGNAENSDLSKFSTFVSIEECKENNNFIDEDEHRIWDKHCQELPLTSTFAERMVFLAQVECEERNNPMSGNQELITKMNMENELAAFECFHLPDQLD